MTVEATSTTRSATQGEEGGSMKGNLQVAALVMGASNGDKQAWDALIERYAPLIWSICRRYRLGGADAEDVAQAVWLKLVDHVGQLRHPAALAQASTATPGQS